MEGHGAATRRGGLATGVKLAFTVPAVLATLPVGVAAADSKPERNHNEHHNDHNETPNHASTTSGQFRQEGAAQTFSTDLCKVSAVSGDDFDKGNVGSDSLGQPSRLRVVRANGDNDRRVFVRLTGAAANATYHVVFVRFNNKGREDIGNVTTDGSGNFRGFTTSDPGKVSGDNRVGLFVLTRNGNDQFVTCIHQHS